MNPESKLYELRQRQRERAALKALDERSRVVYRGKIVQFGDPICKVSIQGQSPIPATNLGGLFALGETVTVRIYDGRAFVKKLEAR